MLSNINDNQSSDIENLPITNSYYRTIVMIERLHRLFLDDLKRELIRMRVYDINNVQCLLLYNIGDNEVNVGDLTHRGYYLGSNVSYNLRKLVENGYLSQKPSRNDRRQSDINLTQKGHELSHKLHEFLRAQAETLSRDYSVGEQTLYDIEESFKSIEKFLNGRN